MTQEMIADSYQNAIKLVRKAKRQRADLASVRETLDHVLKHLTAQAPKTKWEASFLRF